MDTTGSNSVGGAARSPIAADHANQTPQAVAESFDIRTPIEPRTAPDSTHRLRRALRTSAPAKMITASVGSGRTGVATSTDHSAAVLGFPATSVAALAWIACRPVPTQLQARPPGLPQRRNNPMETPNSRSTSGFTDSPPLGQLGARAQNEPGFANLCDKLVPKATQLARGAVAPNFSRPASCQG